MNNYAPIALFVYNRLNNTKETIEALKKNKYATDSELYIFSDGAKNENGLEKVNEVRNYIKTITGFKNITIKESPKNKGLAASIISGVTEIVNQYGNIIVMEDDLISSPHFLKYMNEALDMYKEEKDVASIHGFIYPVSSKLPETFFMKGADCWGWATWKRAWDVFEPDGTKLLEEIERLKLSKEFNFNNSYMYTNMLKDQIAGRNNSWAIRWHASAFLKNMYTLYPGKSLIGNIGMQEGTHCNNDENMVDINPDEIKLTKITPIKSDIENIKIFEAYFRLSDKPFFTRVKGFIKRKLKQILGLIK